MTPTPTDPRATRSAPPVPPPRPAAMPRLRPLTAWLILFGLNLSIPAALAGLVLLPAGWLGLVLGVAGWAGVGVLVLGRFPGLIAPARKGAGLVGLLQPLLVAHIIAGQAAVTLTGKILGVEDQLGFGKPPVFGVAGGFLATAITGAELLAASFFAGLPMQWLADQWARRRAATPVDERSGP